MHLMEGTIPTIFDEIVRKFYLTLEFSKNKKRLTTQVQEKKIKLNEETLEKISEGSIYGVRTGTKQMPLIEFLANTSKINGKSVAIVNRKSFKSEFQLVFDFLNKVILPRSKKKIIASFTDLFVMKYLSSFEFINLPALMMAHIYKEVLGKKGKMACHMDIGLTKYLISIVLSVKMEPKGLCFKFLA